MRKTAASAYAAFREPKNFLIFLVSYVVISLTAHTLYHYDVEFGLTNLVLSIEASIASAALMMLNKRTADAQEISNEQMREMVKTILALEQQQEKTLKGVLLIAEAQRDALLELQGKPHGDDRG